jgi:hypothetical protein
MPTFRESEEGGGGEEEERIEEGQQQSTVDPTRLREARDRVSGTGGNVAGLIEQQRVAGQRQGPPQYREEPLPEPEPEPIRRQEYPYSLQQARVGVSDITQRPPKQGEMDEDITGIESFFKSIAANVAKTVRISVKWRPRDSSEKFSFKDSDVVEVQSFVLDEILKRYGKRFGAGEYAFTFTVPKADGNTYFSHTYNINIDMSEPDKPKVVEPQQSSGVSEIKDIVRAALVKRDESSEVASALKAINEARLADNAAMTAALKSIADGFNKQVGELKEVLTQKKIEDQMRLIEDQNRRLEAMQKSIDNPKQAQQSTGLDMAAMLDKLVVTALKLQTAASPIPPMQTMVQPQQIIPAEAAKEYVNIFRMGFDLAKEAVAASVAAPEAEANPAEAGQGGIMGMLTNVGGKLAEAFANRLAGGAMGAVTPAAAVPAPAALPPGSNPANEYVAYTMNNLVQLIQRGYDPVRCVAWLRANLSPAQVSQIAGTPVTTIVNAVPPIAQYSAQLGAIMVELQRSIGYGGAPRQRVVRQRVVPPQTQEPVQEQVQEQLIEPEPEPVVQQVEPQVATPRPTVSEIISRKRVEPPHFESRRAGPPKEGPAEATAQQ